MTGYIMYMQSCRDLKNFAGVFAIMDGLTQAEVQEQESAWQVMHSLTHLPSLTPHSSLHQFLSLPLLPMD